METPKEYYYTYYSYEEWGRGYFGSRKCYCLPEEDVKYLGSSKDKTFKPKYKIILKDDYATREEAYADEIILQEYYKVAENSHFANRAYQTSTKFYVPTEQARENGIKNFKNCIGIFSRTLEEMKETGRKSGLKCKLNGTGIFSQTTEERRELGRKSGLKTKENGNGVFGRKPEQISEDSRKGGKRAQELGRGIHGRTKEQMIEDGRKSASQRWECIETGFISGPGPLTNYQKARGIDTSKRRRIS
jgi:hypothetical protein